jgi:hypothetical protein
VVKVESVNDETYSIHYKYLLIFGGLFSGKKKPVGSQLNGGQGVLSDPSGDD